MNPSSLHTPHWMLQEILEQPEVVRTCLNTWAIAPYHPDPLLNAWGLSHRDLAPIQQVRIVGCGTSLHAGWVGQYWLESETQLPTRLCPASELRHTLPPPIPNTLTIAISQSGETADVLKGCLQLQAQDAQAGIAPALYIGLTNQTGSSLAALTQATLTIPAGTEVSIAATKTFTATLMAIYGLVQVIRQHQGRSTPQEASQQLSELPHLMSQVIDTVAAPIAAIAQAWKSYRNCIVVGRGIQAPIAAEAALKLKETAYIHAEGFAAGEFLHGPIAILDPSIPVVAIVMPGSTYEGAYHTLAKLKARGAPTLAITSVSGADAVRPWVDDCIVLPDISEALAPLLTILPLQLLAYHWAVQQHLDPDHPRGLVKAISQD